MSVHSLSNSEKKLWKTWNLLEKKISIVRIYDELTKGKYFLISQISSLNKIKQKFGSFSISDNKFKPWVLFGYLMDYNFRSMVFLTIRREKLFPLNTFKFLLNVYDLFSNRKKNIYQLFVFVKYIRKIMQIFYFKIFFTSIKKKNSRWDLFCEILKKRVSKTP